MVAEDIFMSALNAMANNTAENSHSLSASIAADLAKVETILAAKLTSPRRHVARLVAHLDHFRGKRLRPKLLLLTAGACGSITPAHHILGAVVEMIHTATLVHDDVLDEADVRRHAATINAGWGNQASILLGDMLFSRAFHLASRVDAQACAIIGAATNRVCEGELHQITERGNLDLRENEYLDIIDGKTAELTACCCRLGALYAGADDDTVERFASYGRCLGLAFQIADDLLDLVGNEETTGKTLGTDLAQQKLTLPIIHMLHELSKERAVQVRQMLRQPHFNRQALLLLLQETASLQYARNRAEEFADQARACLINLPPSQFRTQVLQLTEWIVRREN